MLQGTMINTPMRQIKAKVELGNPGSTTPIGKNLAKPRPTKTETFTGITSTVDENGIFTVNGTAEIDYTNAYLTPYLKAQHGERNKFPAGTYSISITEYGGSMTGYYSMAITNSKGTTYPGLQKKLVLTEESYVSIFVQFRLGQGADNLQISLQMEKGENVTEYVPYRTGDVFTNETELQEATIERVGEEGKFFGFGICQKANVKIRDINRKIEVIPHSDLNIYFDCGNGYVKSTSFYITETHRDENTNQLSITAYDKLKTDLTVETLQLVDYTVEEFVAACAEALGLTYKIPENSFFAEYYETGANFEGTENLRDALNAVAEATQTIYFIDNQDCLTFRLLDKEAAAAVVVSKEDYITLDSKTNRRLAKITNATELGDNVSVELAVSGTEQFIRDNSFLDLRDDVSVWLSEALDRVGGLTIGQFDMDWRGNFLTEPGDKIEMEAKDGSPLVSYIINDVMSYDGSFSQKTSWSYTENEGESDSNPANLGDALKQTFAKVDKANKQVDIVVSDMSEANSKLTSLQLNTESIGATVLGISTSIDNMSGQVEELSKQVQATMTDEEVRIEIQNSLSSGTTKIATTTGFTFDENGLNIGNTKSDISTTITENGMTVSDGGNAVLVANDEGVQAIDLVARTFLVIGRNSRFEDYENNRTACFWIGG